MKRFKYLNRVSKLLEKKAEDDNLDSLPQVSREVQEIDNYISTKVKKKDVAVTWAEILEHSTQRTNIN